MFRTDRRSLLRAGLAGGTVAALPASVRGAVASALTTIRPDWVVSEAEAMAWHRRKDSHGPALTGNASWRAFTGFVEAELRKAGCVDVDTSNRWAFDRWSAAEWPADTDWSLAIDGRRVPVGNYGANSGITPPEGVTAPLFLYDATDPPVEGFAGRIVVFKPRLTPAMIAEVEGWDYEYRSPFDSVPAPGRPVEQDAAKVRTLSGPLWAQFPQCAAFIAKAVAGKAAGLIFAMDLNAEAVAGLYTFPVPELYGVPSLFVDRNAAAQLVAAVGRPATIRLIARVERVEAYQTVAYLPGRDYGTPADQQIQITTHTDGPSISQDNGAFGLLGVVRYMARIPRADRPKTLLIYLDCRHFMPGAERTFAARDYFAVHPDARRKTVGVIGMEHLGQVEYVEDGDRLRPSGRTDQSSVYVTSNPRMVAAAIAAVKANDLRAASVRATAGPGIHGRPQGPWYGMGSFAQYLGLPGFATMGSMGAYWQTAGRIQRFDPRLFRRQVATFAQLTGFLMTSDTATLRAPPVSRPVRPMVG